MKFFSKCAIISIIDLKQLNMKGGEGDIVPTEEWLIKWKRNRNHRGEEILPKKQAFKLAEEKKADGFKIVKLKKLPRNYQSSPF